MNMQLSKIRRQTTTNTLLVNTPALMIIPHGNQKYVPLAGKIWVPTVVAPLPHAFIIMCLVPRTIKSLIIATVKNQRTKK